MYASMLTAEQQRELQALRARAYGPDADIDSDPRAVARLRELEEYGHLDAAPAGAPETPPSAPAVGEPSAVPDVVPVGWAEPTPARAEAAAPSRVARLRAGLRNVSAGAWVVAASTLLFVAATAWGVTQVTAPRSDLSLAEVDSDGAPPSLVGDNYFTTLFGLTPENMRAHESFRTVTPWSWTGADGTRCLFLVVDGFDRFIDGACTPAGIDPIAHITVWPGLSDELIGDLPQGSVIRFALHDRRVHVWVRAASEGS